MAYAHRQSHAESGRGQMYHRFRVHLPSCQSGNFHQPVIVLHRTIKLRARVVGRYVGFIPDYPVFDTPAMLAHHAPHEISPVVVSVPYRQIQSRWHPTHRNALCRPSRGAHQQRRKLSSARMGIICPIVLWKRKSDVISVSAIVQRCAAMQTMRKDRQPVLRPQRLHTEPLNDYPVPSHVQVRCR